ncbi:hypothetical protein CPB86DRAFT_783541 [Serendipita vermifera]|nr:hypothetical protein CPB86DRAFT_783541 [Serendipita vermifera]
MYSLTYIALLASLTVANVHASLNAINVPKDLMKRAPHPLVPRTLRVPYMGQLLDKRELVKKQTCGIGQDDCPTGGCCDGTCCGDGCCPAGYTCDTSGGESGCCPIGEICTGEVSGCVTPGYVECEGANFCCPPGATCTVDATGSADCTTGGGTGNTNTRTSTTRDSSFTSTPFTNTPTSTRNIFTTTPVGNNNGNNNGINSGAGRNAIGAVGLVGFGALVALF